MLCVRIGENESEEGEPLNWPTQHESVAADVCLAGHQNEGSLGFAIAISKGVQQADHAGISKGDAKGNGSGNGEGDNKSN